MTTTEIPLGRTPWRLPRRHVPVLATLALLLVMYGVGVSQYRAFSNVQVVFNIFTNATGENVYTANADGTGLAQVTHGGEDEAPDWGTHPLAR